MDTVTPKLKFKTVDEYISMFPPRQQQLLQQLRKTIKEAAPQAEEVISYNMPAFRMRGILVYYAAFGKHIGFYPTSSPMIAFRDEIATYKTSKGAIRFPVDKDIPTDLVKAIVRFRIAEDAEKGKKAGKHTSLD